MDRRSFLFRGAGLILFGSISAIGFSAIRQDKNTRYKVIPQRCNGCGHCLRACRDKAISPVNNKAVIDKNKCKGCGDCTRFCRFMAIVEDKQ